LTKRNPNDPMNAGKAKLMSHNENVAIRIKEESILASENTIKLTLPRTPNSPMAILGIIVIIKNESPDSKKQKT
jgi:hypothetical protein